MNLSELVRAASAELASIEEHLRSAIAEGCTRDDEHDHVRDHRAAVVRWAAAKVRTACRAEPGRCGCHTAAALLDLLATGRVLPVEPGRKGTTIQETGHLMMHETAGQAPAPQPETHQGPGVYGGWETHAGRAEKCGAPDCGSCGCPVAAWAPHLARICEYETPAPQPETAPDTPTVTRDPEVRGGEPCIPGTRVPAAEVAALLADGLTPAEVHSIYPTVSTPAAARLAATAADAETGTPDGDLRDRIALALARADQTGALGTPEERAHEYTPDADAALAVVAAETAALRAERDRLRIFATATEQRHAEIRDHLATLDIRTRSDAWSLGAAIIAILDSPPTALRKDTRTASHAPADEPGGPAGAGVLLCPPHLRRAGLGGAWRLAIRQAEDDLPDVSERIRAIHHEVDGTPMSTGSCIEDGQDYPCATLRALYAGQSAAALHREGPDGACAEDAATWPCRTAIALGQPAAEQGGDR